MIRLQDGRRVQWKDGERYYVGAVIVWSDTGEDVRVAYGCVMVRVHPSDELASVGKDWLLPYPAESIPEPTNTGRTD